MKFLKMKFLKYADYVGYVLAMLSKYLKISMLKKDEKLVHLCKLLSKRKWTVSWPLQENELSICSGDINSKNNALSNEYKIISI